MSGALLAASLIMIVRYLTHEKSLGALAPKTTRADDWKPALVMLGTALGMAALAFASVRKANRFHLSGVREIVGS
jgi:hypothetical protein